MLEEFRQLVREGVLQVTAENEVVSVRSPTGSEPGGAPGKEQLGEPSEVSEEEVRYVRRRLRERLERNRHSAESSAPAPRTRGGHVSAGLRREVVERIAEKLLERWGENGPATASLREETIELLAEELIRRWDAEG